MTVSPGQPHPVDLRWVDELVRSARPHLVLRPEDELLILVPNRPVKVNRTALRILGAMLDEGLGHRRACSPARATVPAAGAEIHHFFADLKSWLDGSIGEGHGRRAVVQEPFTADFCRYPVLAEVALTYRCNLTCGFCYAGCGTAGLPEGWSEERVMSDDEVCRVLEVIRHDARCPSVSFTGGEPTLRPALPRFVRHAKGARPQGQPHLERPAPRRASAWRRSPRPASTRPSSRSKARPRRSTTRSWESRAPSTACGRGVERPPRPRHSRPHQHDAQPPQPRRGRGHRRPRGRTGASSASP